MSLVYITYHNENIYNIESDNIEKGASHAEHRRAHHAKSRCKYGEWLRNKLKDEFKKLQIIDQKNGEKLVTTAKKCKHRTMGCAKTPINPPCDFLRKNQGVKWRHENDHKCPPSRDIPPVPRGLGKKPDRENKDFIRVNIEKIKSAMPKRSLPRYVDTPFGTRHNVINSGLIPQYICRKDFGKVPCYLVNHKKVLHELRARCMPDRKALHDICDELKPVGVRKMTDEERAEILEGLKQHLTELTKNYQSMSLYMDTISKRLRKGKLESDLRQVEQDILLVETSPIIYISEV